MTDTKTIKLPDADELHSTDWPVFGKYASQHDPQPGRLKMDLRTGEIDYDFYPHIGGGDDPEHYYGVIKTWSLPYGISGPQLAKLIEEPELQTLLKNLLNTAEVTGPRGDQRADWDSDIDDEIEGAIKRLTPPTATYVSGDDWMDGSNVDDIVNEKNELISGGFSASEALETIASNIAGLAALDGAIVLEAEIIEWLEDQCTT